MAKLIINDRDVTVSLSVVEKFEALHGDVTVPRSAVAQVRTVPDGMVEVHGLRATRHWPFWCDQSRNVA